MSCCKLKKIYVRYENFIYIGWAPVLGLPGLAGLSFMTVPTKELISLLYGENTTWSDVQSMYYEWKLTDHRLKESDN